MKNEPIIAEPETTLGDAIEGICQARDQAIAERDKWNRWAADQAIKLHVKRDGFLATDQAGQWEEMRQRISEAIDKLPDAERQ